MPPFKILNAFRGIIQGLVIKEQIAEVHIRDRVRLLV
jgi:hypothetical protein